ncbi:MAG TPA: helix-turn-helix transcriptional regulator [Streptosporangiaceae bacterium]
MASPNRPSVRFRRIGAALRQARESRGLTIETAARRFGRSPGWMSTTENGLQIIRVDDLADLLDFYRVTDDTLRESLLHLAARGRRKNWERAYEGRISAAALDLASLEADSAEIRTFQPSLIPGLLQTADYTGALIAAGLPGATENADELVTFRMARQNVLTRHDPPIFRAIIGEAALHHQVGSRTVMEAQFSRLLEAASLDHVALHMLPFSASACLWLAGPFDLFSLRPPGRLTVSVVEHFTQNSFVEAEQEVATHEQIFDHLLAAALNESRSLDVIERILSES